MQEKFHAMPDDRAVFENVPSSISFTQVFLVRPVWRCLEDTTGYPAGRGQSSCHGTASCLSVYRKPGETIPVLAGQHGIAIGCCKGPQ